MQEIWSDRTHAKKTYNETVYDSDDPPPAQPKPKRAKKEKVPASTSTPKNKRAKKEKVPASTTHLKARGPRRKKYQPAQAHH